MTKKRVSSSSSLERRVLGLKLAVGLLTFLCFVALLRPIPQSQCTTSGSGSFRFQAPPPKPKVAFLFLARQNLPLDFLWHTFFKNGDVSNFSIYIHSKPGFVFNETTTRSAFFINRQLRSSIQVVWGEPTMIEAERLLFEVALADPANQRFVLLSDSCVPLYNFSYIYNHLMSSSRSFVDSFLDVKEVRYNPQMSPLIPKHAWRKGSQWITLVRRHAEVVVNDSTVFPVFKKFCRRQRMRSFMSLSKGEMFSNLLLQHNCIPDEHYVQTLLVMSGLEAELERRTLTYSSWNKSIERTNTNSWHPVTFQYSNANHQQIKEIKGIYNVYYDSEKRTEWCKINSTPAPCFLFARKFSPGAAMRLLDAGVVGPYDATSLLDRPI